MARYIVGDIQGCLRELKLLLHQVEFNPKFDELWCVGDIVGRGPDSLGCLKLLRQLGQAVKIVLGNHDLNLLAVLCGVRKAHPSDQLESILALPEAERNDWIQWLVQQPLLLRSSDQLVMTHAGIYPWWSITEAEALANEVSQQLQAAWHEQQLPSVLKQMYGDGPEQWHASLTGAERLRFIINAFTRMRYCYADSRLELKTKTAPHSLPADSELVPWFEFWNPTAETLVFGHWAALHGNTARDDVLGLDTGCVWGEKMTMMRWPNRQRITCRAEVN